MQYARVVAGLVLTLTLGAGCHDTGQRVTTAQTSPVLVAHLTESTVALVRLVKADGEDATGHLVLYCAGTWISPWCIVTADHCVGHNGDEVLYALPGDIAKGAPAGHFWRGRVLRTATPVDTAVVETDYPYPTHEWIRVGSHEIGVGDRVEIMGHPGRYGWVYSEGLVSSILPFETNADGTPMPTIMVQSVIAPGNSGGGLFDTSGALIGLASYGDSSTPGHGYFVHRDAVRDVLVKAGCLR